MVNKVCYCCKAKTSKIQSVRDDVQWDVRRRQFTYTTHFITRINRRQHAVTTTVKSARFPETVHNFFEFSAFEKSSAAAERRRIAAAVSLRPFSSRLRNNKHDKYVKYWRNCGHIARILADIFAETTHKLYGNRLRNGIVLTCCENPRLYANFSAN